MLTDNQVEEYLAVLRIGVDPESAFFGMVSYNDLSRLPISDQHQIHDSMNDTLRGMIESFKATNGG